MLAVVECRNFHLFLGKTSKNILLPIRICGKNPKHKLTPEFACVTICAYYVGNNKEKVEPKIKEWLGVKIIRDTYFLADADGG